MNSLFWSSVDNVIGSADISPPLPLTPTGPEGSLLCSRIVAVKILCFYYFFREEHASPFGIGRSDLDPFAGPGSGMIFDPMRSGMPSYGPPAGGIGGPNRLPR